jgi:hypothetical protein
METIKQVPKTGRIGRFSKVVVDMTDQDISLRILDKSDEYCTYRPECKASWWKNAVEQLENELGDEKAVEIMRICGSKCCGQGLRKTAKRLMDESYSVTDFLEKVSHYEVRDGELEYELIDENTILGRHNRCFCGQVKRSKERFHSGTYCQCSVEFNKQFFQAAFGRPVQVKLMQSILEGGDCCEFEIRVVD